MQAKQEWVGALLIVVGTLLLTLLVSSWSEIRKGEICKRPEHGQVEECAHYGAAQYIVVRSADFLESHNGAITAIATVVLAAFTWKLWNSTSDLVRMTEGSTRIIERAYVKMSHRPPGIKWFEKARGGGNFTIEMEIRNTGNTPATITDVVVRPFVTIPGEPFPDTPPVRRTRLERAFNAFLVKNDFFYSTPELMWVDNEVEIEKGEAVLYLFVHVDYIDQFGVRHRAGYLRRYEPRLDKLPKRRGNLVFVAEAKFNFDRLRKPGEGNDWDEKPPA